MITILRGIPGSGKSTLARATAMNPTDWVDVISADDYFMRNDQYIFDRNKLGEAHIRCFHKALMWAEAGVSPRLIVDNTNIHAWEIAPYVALGQARGGGFEIITVPCLPEVGIARNTHNVPSETIMRMYRDLQNTQLPAHWKPFHKIIQ